MTHLVGTWITVLIAFAAFVVIVSSVIQHPAAWAIGVVVLGVTVAVAIWWGSLIHRGAPK